MERNLQVILDGVIVVSMVATKLLDFCGFQKVATMATMNPKGIRKTPPFSDYMGKAGCMVAVEAKKAGFPFSIQGDGVATVVAILW